MPAHIFGILNITDDSFSDGGQFLNHTAALAQAEHLYTQGANVIDIGAAASHPDARSIATKLEIARLQKIIPALQSRNIAISIDSFSPDVQIWALAQNVDYLNDVGGFAQAQIYPQLAEAAAKLIVMYASPHKMRTRSAANIIDEISNFFDTRLNALRQAGIAQERLIIDPGMGRFLRKFPQASLRVLAGIPTLYRRFELPIMISVSRKQFLRELTGRDFSTIAPINLIVELYAIAQGAQYIRTHEAAQLSDSLRLHDALQNI